MELVDKIPVLPILGNETIGTEIDYSNSNLIDHSHQILKVSII